MSTITMSFPQSNSKTLYHYTSTSAMFHILDEGLLKISESSFVNDTSELKFFDRILHNELDKLRGNGEIDEKRYCFVNQLIDREWTVDDLSGVYVLSLTEDTDSLLMWHYLQSSGECNLGFNAEKLFSTLNNNHIHHYRGKVIYEPLEQQLKAKEFLVIFTKWCNEANEYGLDMQFQVLRRVVSCFFKNPLFRDEREYRVAFPFVKIDQISFREHRNSIIPYLLIDIKGDCFPITHIRLGPRNASDIVQHGLKLYLQHHPTYRHICVNKSGLSLRH